MNSISRVQHNVAHWKTNRLILSNTYRQLNPDIILINSHGLPDTEPIKLHGYNTYQNNSSGGLHDGSAILIKSNIQHKMDDNFITDCILVTIHTNTGPINIATTYLPPRRPYLPYPDIHQIASNNAPTYIIGDLNAKHNYLGDNYNNRVGAALKHLIDRNLIRHLGPNFPTFFSYNSSTNPDIILSNKHTYHNTKVEAGPVTASDHIPIIFTITSKAITAPVFPRPNLKLADWDQSSSQFLPQLLLSTPLPNN